MDAQAPVIMIGLDAMDASLVETLCAQGRLPALQSLRSRGCFGVLQGDANLFAGGVWPTFYTASRVPWHGIYNNKMWRPEHMQIEFVTDSHLRTDPFWVHLPEPDFRIAVVDLPMAARPPRPGFGVHLNGWGAHDHVLTGSWPQGLWAELERDFGSPILGREPFGHQSEKTLLSLRDELLRTTEQMSRLSVALLHRHAWDLFLVTFSATHRGGHYLWDLSQIDETHLDPATRKTLTGALLDVYQACDAAVARLIETAPRDARIMAFAVHGMGPNPGWADRCDDIISKIQLGRRETPNPSRVKDAIPRSLRRRAVARLPAPIARRLTRYYTTHRLDWATVRYFPVPMDHAGYVRINLKGRESQGAVEPGAEYRDLCAQLREALLDLHDAGTGKAIVAAVHLGRDLAPEDAPCRDILPDLVIEWGQVPATTSSGLRSARYGTIEWKDRLPSGRAGNHRAHGWFIAAGGGIPQAAVANAHDVVDLIPTVFHWLGAPMPPSFQGRPIPALIGHPH